MLTYTGPILEEQNNKSHMKLIPVSKQGVLIISFYIEWEIIYFCKERLIISLLSYEVPQFFMKLLHFNHFYNDNIRKYILGYMKISFFIFSNLTQILPRFTQY